MLYVSQFVHTHGIISCEAIGVMMQPHFMQRQHVNDARKRVDFLFAKFNKRICGPPLVMEKMLTGETAAAISVHFLAQISFLLALQHLSFKKIA